MEDRIIAGSDLGPSGWVGAVEREREEKELMEEAGRAVEGELTTGPGASPTI